MPRSHLSLLIRLRWTLSRRALSRAGRVTRILYFIGICGMSIAFFVGVRNLIIHSSDPEGAVRVIFTAYLALATLMPMLSFHQGSAYDPSVLFQYPIRPVTVFWGAVLARFLSIGALVPMATVLGVVSAMPGTLGDFVLRGSAGLAFLFLPVLTSQILMLELHTLLSRRRTRDLLTLASTFVAVGLYLALRLAMTDAPVEDLSLVARQVPETVWWVLPSTWVSGVITRGLDSGGLDLVGTLVFAIAILLLSRWGGRSAARAFFAEVQTQVSVAPTKGTTRDTSKARIDGTPMLWGLSPVIREIVQRELRHFWRDPVLKGMVIRQLGLMTFPILFPMVSNESQISGGLLVHITTLLLVLSECSVLLNLLTLEGKGLQHTFLLPIKGRDLLLGKNLAYALWFVPLNLIVLQAVNQFSGQPMAPPAAAVQAIACFAAACALGNLASVFLPVAQAAAARRAMQTQAAESRGVGRVFARLLLLFALALLCGPIFVATTPPWPVTALTAAFCGLAALLYSLCLYGLALWLAGRALLQRQQALLKIVG